MPAQMLAQTRPGARGALLFYACVPGLRVRRLLAGGVPVQIHGMEADPFVGEGDLEPPASSSSRPTTRSCSCTPAISTCSPTPACRRTTRSAAALLEQTRPRLPRDPLEPGVTHRLDPATRPGASPSGRSCSTPTGRRPADGGRPADDAAARPDGRGGAQRRPRRVEPPGHHVPARHLQQALEQDRTLFEHHALVRPMSDRAACDLGR